MRRRLLWLLGRRRRVRVTGPSMEPTLAEGAVAYVDPRAFRQRGPLPGEIVHCRHPFRRSVTLVKRVDRTDGDRVFLRGDNPSASTDSRTLGPVFRNQVLGRVDVEDRPSS